jgi:oligopeptide transport system permease protein
MATSQSERAIGVLDAGAVYGRQRNLWVDAFRRLIRNRFALAGLILVGLFIVLAIFAGPLGRYDPYNYQNYSALNQAPSLTHFFGTDDIGHDNWARVLIGLRVSLAVGLSVAAIVFVIGTTMGCLAALGGSATDMLVMRIVDVAYSFPDLLLIIIIEAIFHAGVVQTVIAISLVAWTTLARLVRGQMLSLKQAEYVTAARTLGASQPRIIVQHILPNTLGPVIVALTFIIPSAIFAEAALTFIGFGLPPPTASLGRLIQHGYETISVNPWIVTFSALSVALMMLSFTFIGDGLRDALDPRSRTSS